MSEVLELSLRVPVVGTYDVIVVGGGPAGIGAALSAARQGVTVLLIEAYGFLGGMWTMGMVNPLFDYENKGGICRELVEDMERLHMGVRCGPDIWNFDLETMKRLLEEKLIGAGVTLLYHTVFARPWMDGETVVGVVVENKGGTRAYRAGVVIDCTGDGDVACRAGVPCEIGQPGTGLTQPMTLMMRLSNVAYIQDYYNYPHHTGNELIIKLENAMMRAGVKDYPFNYRRPCLLKVPGSHQALCQAVHVRGRLATDPEDLTQAEIEGRALAKEFFDLMKAYMPEFQDAYLDATGPHIGIRESRRIVGEYVLTLDDIIARRRFDDGVLTVTFWVDIHQPTGDDQHAQSGATLDTRYEVPYRCLVPLKISGLLVAGRCISGTFEAHASYRVTGDCVAMGQAAGVAAAMAVRRGVPVRSIDGAEVARQMECDGAVCHAWD